MFFIPYDDWHIIPYDDFKRYVVAFFEINLLKEVLILRYLHKNITNIFQSKAVLNYTYFTFWFCFNILFFMNVFL